MRVLQTGKPIVWVVAVVAFFGHFYWLFPTFEADPVTATALPPTLRQEAPAAALLQQTTNNINNKSILYIHFHKSGGTEVCRTVEQTMNITTLEGLPVPRQRNCNTDFSGPNANPLVIGDLQTCKHLIPYTNVDVNFVAVEVPFQDSMPCGLFRSFAIMRDPVTRLQSHMRAHRNWSQDRIMACIRNRTPAPSNYYMDGYPIVNSMVIRQLLGRERFIDTEPINEQDLEKAKQIVDKFDAFVPMEYLDHPYVQQLLQKTVPEYVKGQQIMAMKQTQAKKQPQTRKGNTYNPTPDFLNLITQENKYDILLYQYVLNKLGIS